MEKRGDTMNIQKQYLADLAAKNKRIDGRRADEFRSVTIETGVIPQAEGSALVALGGTKVMAGVKMEVGEPFPDTPNEGVLIVNAELSPLAAPTFELGPPDEESIELARIVDRGIRESKAIDTEKLCIEAGKKVWMVFVDIQPLNHDGNLIDASGIAAIAALLSARIPKYENEKVIYEEKTDPLPVKEVPVPATFAVVNNKLLVDPGIMEELAMVTRLTVTTNGDGNICALQKGGTGELSLEMIQEALKVSVEKGKEIRKLFK
jgi:exosome complex component RRP42